MLQCVQLSRLWGRYNVDWTPNPDVNILVGVNGSGKTTLLRVLDVALSNGLDRLLSLSKYLSSGYAVRLKGDNIDVKIEDAAKDNYRNSSCAYDMLNTFDEIVREKKALEQEQSPLTAQLYAAIFNTRMMSLNGYRLKATENAASGIRISERLQEWVHVVNSFFATTGKAVEMQGSDVFFLQDDGKPLTLDKLSSGEKQLLIILTNALVQDMQPFILLMDEPEISLDVDWQYKLIGAIRRLNPNCQLIIATHSPGIFGDGWNDKLFFMEDLLKK